MVPDSPSNSQFNGHSNSLGQQIDTLAATSNLTPGQLLLWLGQKLNPETPLYNMVFSFTIQGKIDPVHFQRAFQALIAHSDILRLTITESDGIPHQTVAPTLNYSLPIIDFSTDTAPTQASQTWMQQRSTCLLNLQDCLFDAALLKLSSDRFIWYLNQHHLITDNWSVSLLYRRLQEYYGQSLTGTLATATDLPAYLDYAESQQQPATWQAITHWQQKREHTPPSVPLYGQNGQTTDIATARTERTYFELGPERSEALRALAKTPEARTLSIHQSQFNLFLTLVFAYLYRVSGSHELAIAAPAHNRPTPILKETPGVFMELFPLQVDIEPGETFTSLLGKVARESMAFLRYAQSDVSHHGISRDVNVVLSYINVTFPDFHGMPVKTDWIHSGYGDSQHHLRLEVQDFDATGSFTLQFDFNSDLIADTQRQWATEHFCNLLDAWMEDAHQEIEGVDILAAEERALLFGSGSAAKSHHPDLMSLLPRGNNGEALISEANGRASVAYDTSPSQGEENLSYDSTLVGRFQQQADLVPDQTAVVFGQQTLTYAELNTQANQLAHYLGKQGVQKGMTVGLFMERSVSMVVSILAILKAGAAYLPIDPAYPAERTRFMVADGQVSVVLTQQALLEKCPTGQMTDQIICLEDHAIVQEPTGAPEVAITAQDLAYILFTSGSTGQPKGVMVEHRNVLAMVNGFEQTAPAGEQLRGTALCSYGFDVSVWEIFSNLCFGGTVYVVPPEIVASHNQFAQYLIAHDITSAYIPPALLPMVIQELEKADHGSEHKIVLDRILVGVEPIQQKLLQRYRQRLPQLRIVNGYGPTETTVCATFYAFDTVTDPQGIVPIGKAVPGYEVYVVNAQGQQVPMGVKGEIVIGGAGLSRGYLNRPELMAERFIENPFGAGKLYKTGDQARQSLDGNLEFLGRLDHQVKIRGFRVELREVEAALNQHPSIQQGVVIAEKNSQGRQSLLAYVVTSESSLTHREIRDVLQQNLPDYMVPTGFVLLDHLPLTPNGKVDRRLLSSSDYTQRQRLGTDSNYVAPGNEWETHLASIWAQCLRIESVGIYDNFFDLGGDSITAIQIAAQATEAGLVLSPQQILQHLTVAGVLAQIGATQLVGSDQGQTSGQVPLTPVQQSFFEQNLTEPHHWNQSLLLDVAQSLDPTVLETALQHLVERHNILSGQFILGESGWQQRQAVSAPGRLLNYVDLSHQSIIGQDRAMAATEADLQTSLDLTTGKLVQAALFNLGDNRPNRLLLIIHHLAVDGVSWLTLLNDLETAYRQTQGETVPQPLPTMSFQTWSTELSKTAASGAFQSELDYWLGATKGAISLPRDNARVSVDNRVASAHSLTTCLTVDQTHMLLRELPKVSRARVNEILLTALAQALCDQTNQLLVDLEGHGREEAIVPGANLVRTVGWFTTVFPLLLTLPQTDVGEQLRSVKEQVRQVPRNGIGYGLLRYLGGDPGVKAQLEAQPQPDILFNYLGDLAGLVPPGSMFQLARGLRLSRSPKGQRHYLLEVNAAVVKGQLQVEWTYGQQHQRDTVQGWADGMMQGVRSQITHYLSPESKQDTTLTPVDFPLANLDRQKLGKIAALLNRSGSQSGSQSDSGG